MLVTRGVEAIEAIEAVVRPAQGTAVTVGVFDGVHQGHREVVSRTVRSARERGLVPTVVTFDPHPLRVLRPAAAPLMLTTVAHRAELLAELGVEWVLVLDFTAELASWPPEEFVRHVLVDAVAARVVVVGDDFRFGARAAGDVAQLTAIGREAGFEVEEVALVGSTGHRWSSTFVRDRIALGDVEQAARVLLRPHRLEGPVVRGDQRGRELGYPTANVEVAASSAVPADGVYAVWLQRDAAHSSERLPAALSIGTNPTFDGTQRRVEAYVLDRTDLNLYDEHVALDLVARVRDSQVRFADIVGLVAQIEADVARTRRLLGL